MAGPSPYVPTEAQMRRLPRWAVSYIRTLEHQVRSLTDDIAEADADTWVTSYSGTDVDRPIGKAPTIRFDVSEPTLDTPNRNTHGFGVIEARVVRRGGGRPQLAVRCPVGGLVVRPESSNAVLVEAPGDW